MNTQPMIGNLAWAPVPAFEEVEVLDRFNGVPTLGVFGGPGAKILFWRVAGYVTQPGEYSVWLYVPLEPADEAHLDSAEPDDLLNGLVFGSDVPRRATVGMALGNRLQYEFKWKLPRDAQPSDLVRLASQFAESSKSLQDQAAASSKPLQDQRGLPQIVAEHIHEEPIRRIWEMEDLPEDVRLGVITLALAMRARRDEGRRGA